MHLSQKSSGFEDMHLSLEDVSDGAELRVAEKYHKLTNIDCHATFHMQMIDLFLFIFKAENEHNFEEVTGIIWMIIYC